jgi:ribosomal protein S12 methylthiotransferase accessory factor
MQLGTSLRERSPEETVKIAREWMSVFGISRVIDVTQRDRISLPVFVSCRPRGKTLRVHAGKGLSPADALAGALMEAIEYAVSERHAEADADATWPLRDLVAALPSRLGLDDFAPRLGAVADGNALTPSVLCEELVRGGSALLPAELVSMPFDYGDAIPLFGWSTNGLASGNSLEEATLHAMLEILERDALAMNLARNGSRLILGSSLPAPFRSLASGWLESGVELIVRYVPNALDLPCFEAALVQPTSRRLRVSRGWGLHFDRHVALSRAICEAAQTRLLAMRRRGTNVLDAARADQLLARLSDRHRVSEFDATPHAAPQTVCAASRELFARLADKGFKYVFRRQMSLGGGPAAERHGLLYVVKVVMPRCEFAAGSRIRMGPRLRARVLGKR